MPCEKTINELCVKRPLLELPEKVLKTKEEEIENCRVAPIAAASLENLRLIRGSARALNVPCWNYPRKY
jgi:hypothetical protein